MKLNIGKEVAALKLMTMKELRAKFAELFQRKTCSNNKTWLVRRIVWRLQALSEGNLTERARRRADELASDAELRLCVPVTRPLRLEPDISPNAVLTFGYKHRLPLPGTILIRRYKGQTLQVRVLAQGFEFEGQVYKSLSSVANAITGSHCNGHLFFRLKESRAKA